MGIWVGNKPSGECMVINMSSPGGRVLRRIATERGLSVLEVFSRALMLYDEACEREKVGLHLGFVADVDKLDERVVGL